MIQNNILSTSSQSAEGVWNVIEMKAQSAQILASFVCVCVSIKCKESITKYYEMCSYLKITETTIKMCLHFSENHILDCQT